MTRTTTRFLLTAGFILLSAFPAQARERFFGYCRVLADASPTQCLITVFDQGTTDLSTIYSDNSGTIESNPFTSETSGFFRFYADDARYDVRQSGGSIVTPFTWADVLLDDTEQNVQTIVAIASGATPAFDVGNASIITFVLTENVTSSTITNGVTGQVIRLYLAQDGTGGWTFAWPADVQLRKGGYTISSDASAVSTIVLWFDGTNWREHGRDADEVFIARWNDIRIVDGARFTTCQAAEDDLGSNPGLVVIPSTYAGADCTSVSANVVIRDLRATAAVSGTSSQSKYLLFSGNATPLDDIGGLFPSFPRRGLMLVQDEIADSGAGSSGVTESAEDAIQAAIRTLDPHKDVVAFYGQCIVDVATDGGGCWGANFQAIGGSGLDTKLSGIEIDMSNQNTAGALGSEAKNGILLNAFNGQIGTAILVGSGDSGTGVFQDGLSFTSNAMNTSTGALIAAQSGTFNNGLDWSLATFNGNAIRLRNTEGILLLGTAAAHANIFNNSDNFLNIVSGSAGTVIRDNAGSVNNLIISDAGTVTVNDGQSATADLVVKSDNQAQMLFVDASGDTVAIGGGAGIKAHLSGTASLNYDLSGAGITCQDLTITVTGAVAGSTDTVTLALPNALATTAGFVFSAWVNTANTVTVRACDVTSSNADPAAATVRADVWSH